MLFNSKLSAELDDLKNNLPNSMLIYVDIYNPLLDMIINPTNYGFEVSNKGCCGRLLNILNIYIYIYI
ncbi:hypothetical protein COP1_016138 [Malus domestica]